MKPLEHLLEFVGKNWNMELSLDPADITRTIFPHVAEQFLPADEEVTVKDLTLAYLYVHTSVIQVLKEHGWQGGFNVGGEKE